VGPKGCRPGPGAALTGGRLGRAAVDRASGPGVFQKKTGGSNAEDAHDR
jgi:hypothetical protein